MPCRSAALATGVLFAAASATAEADPYRLRADAFASARSPVGLVVLEAEGDLLPWMEAEAVLWGGRPELETSADALVVAMTARDPGGRGELKLGRFVQTAGGLRPVHLDGVDARGRLPIGTSFEAFGGLPVVPAFGERRGDWLVGARIAQRLADLGSLGVAALHQRDAGRIADSEAAVDLSLLPLETFTIGARGAYDLVQPGVSEAVLSVGLLLRGLRVEAYGSHRSPSRILPATSLFSVLGDVPSRRAGGLVFIRVAPRLDLVADGGVRIIDSDPVEDLRVAATLRLDGRGDGALSLELRRVGGEDTGWIGGRLGARVLLVESVTASAELELARPDEGRRGSVWPWSLLAVAWRIDERWEAALAMEAGASPEHRFAIDGLARLAYLWSSP